MQSVPQSNPRISIDQLHAMYEATSEGIEDGKIGISFGMPHHRWQE